MKSIIIIGGGLSGLSAGCYARMNGYKSQIFEMHSMPGGLVTSWKRKDYQFDGCIDWLVGVDQKGEDSQIWKELGVLKDKKISYFDELLRVKDTDGKEITFYADPVKLEKELTQLTDYPEDKKIIKKLCKAIAKFEKAPAFSYKKPEALYGIFDKIALMFKFMPYLGILIKYNKLLVRDFVKQFKSERLRRIVSYIFFTPDAPYSLFPAMYTLSNMHKKNAGFPQGGSMGLARSLEQRYKDLGGEIHYKKRVKKIIIENNQAKGVVLENGEEYYSDIVISSCDGHTTIYNLLEGKYASEEVQNKYNEAQVHPSLMRVFIGVNQDFSKEPHTAIHLSDKGYDFPGSIHEKKEAILIRHYSQYEKSFAPNGKSVLVSFYFADYDYWKNLYDNDKDKYKEKKAEVAEIVVNHLEETYPGIKEKIEYIDVSSPVTIERYTGNHKGSIMGWIATDEIDVWTKKIGVMLPDLDNFFMIGQWVVYGGFPRVAGSGRFAIQMQCQKDNKKFVADYA